MERTEIGIGNMRIDVVDDNVVYINLNGWTYYIDDSTNEQLLEKYKERVKNETFCPLSEVQKHDIKGL
jgi:hypothetical protein